MKEIHDSVFESTEGKPIRVFANRELLENMQKDGSLKQAEHVASLPGLVGPAMVMPDAHLGYGFPVGGVAAADAKEGFISPGGIGFDINCGVRLLLTCADEDSIKPHLESILKIINKLVPSGMNTASSLTLTKEQLDDVLTRGISAILALGIGTKDDAEHCENNGHVAGANPELVSNEAKKRGIDQLGTLGSGNHFLEIQTVEKIFDETTAKVFGLKPKQVVVMIHCGSRGLGHQICTDYVDKFMKEFPEIAGSLDEKDLMYAPVSSEQGQAYIAAMRCAMNFAWANRHVIGHKVREAFSAFGFTVSTLYDLGHNNAKLEHHAGKDVYVHRKGAARAFDAKHTENAQFKQTGHPVLVPGSMGTASYVLVGTKEGMERSYGSCCHGAGRVMSRRKAMETLTADGVKSDLAAKNVKLFARSKRGIVEEAPQAYKDIDTVIEVCANAKIALPVARLVPIGVIKG